MINPIEFTIKDERLKTIQLLLEKIIEKKNKKYVGKTFKVLCDSYNAKYRFFIGRPYFSAPEVDFEVWFKSYKQISIGSFVDVRIVDFSNGCFIGEIE